MKICAETAFETCLFLAKVQEKSMWIFSKGDSRLTVEPPGKGDKYATQKPLSRFPFTLQTCNEGLDELCWALASIILWDRDNTYGRQACKAQHPELHFKADQNCLVLVRMMQDIVFRESAG